MGIPLKTLLFLCLLSTVISSCRHHPYQTTYKRHQVKNDVYREGEEVYIGDFVVCKNLRKRFKHYEFPGNHDHYIENFLHALETTQMTIKVKDSMQNHCDKGFTKNHTLSKRKMDVEDFPLLFQIRNKGIHLIPLIHIDNMWESTFYMTSTGMSGVTGTGKQRTTFLTMAIYIYRDAELVYRKQMWYRAIPRDIYEDFEEDFNLQQGHWEALVRKVLDEYIVY